MSSIRPRVKHNVNFSGKSYFNPSGKLLSFTNLNGFGHFWRISVLQKRMFWDVFGGICCITKKTKKLFERNNPIGRFQPVSDIFLDWLLNSGYTAILTYTRNTSSSYTLSNLSPNIKCIDLARKKQNWDTHSHKKKRPFPRDRVEGRHWVFLTHSSNRMACLADFCSVIRAIFFQNFIQLTHGLFE